MFSLSRLRYIFNAHIISIFPFNKKDLCTVVISNVEILKRLFRFFATCMSLFSPLHLNKCESSSKWMFGVEIGPVVLEKKNKLLKAYINDDDDDGRRTNINQRSSLGPLALLIVRSYKNKKRLLPVERRHVIWNKQCFFPTYVSYEIPRYYIRDSMFNPNNYENVGFFFSNHIHL